MNGLRHIEFSADLDPHTPLANTLGAATLSTETLFEPPRIGTGVTAEPLTDDGTEAIAVGGAGASRPGYLDTSRPSDIAVATFGPPPPTTEAIRGPDERIRVTSTSAYPWSANASLQIIAPDGEIYVGTGWFVSAHTLVTAGHCIFIHDRAGRFADWAREIRVVPGRDRVEAPFGSAVSTTFRTVAGWARDRDPRFDYGVIDIPLPLGETVGTYGYGFFGDDQLVGRTANISGYPGDKIDTEDGTRKEDGTQWYDSKEIVKVDDQKVYYDIDTFGGQSGSAVYVGEAGERVAIGIHAYGDSYFGNSATRITRPVYDNIKGWQR